MMQNILSIDACTAAVGKVVANEMCDNEYMAAVHGVEKEEVDENRAMMHLRHEAPTPAVSLAPHGLGPAECLCDVCMMIWPKQADADSESNVPPNASAYLLVGAKNADGHVKALHPGASCAHAMLQSVRLAHG